MFNKLSNISSKEINNNLSKYPSIYFINCLNVNQNVHIVNGRIVPQKVQELILNNDYNPDDV